jgi:hypothetical protein
MSMTMRGNQYLLKDSKSGVVNLPGVNGVILCAILPLVMIKSGQILAGILNLEFKDSFYFRNI